MTLNMKEKEYWKDRISQKIEQKIREFVAANDPNYLESMPARVRVKAIEKLGLTENQATQAKIESEIHSLESTLTQLKQESLRITSSYSKRDVLSKPDWQMNEEIENKIKSLKPVLERQIMRGEETGKEILTLRDEKEEILDFVWLATTNKQIRDLWLRVTESCSEKTTERKMATVKLIDKINEKSN